MSTGSEIRGPPPPTRQTHKSHFSRHPRPVFTDPHHPPSAHLYPATPATLPPCQPACPPLAPVPTWPLSASYIVGGRARRYGRYKGTFVLRLCPTALPLPQHPPKQDLQNRPNLSILCQTRRVLDTYSKTSRRLYLSKAPNPHLTLILPPYHLTFLSVSCSSTEPSPYSQARTHARTHTLYNTPHPPSISGDILLISTCLLRRHPISFGSAVF